MLFDSIVVMLGFAKLKVLALSLQQKMLALYTIILCILLFKVVYSIVCICGVRQTEVPYMVWDEDAIGDRCVPHFDWFT